MTASGRERIAIVIPCHDESHTIAKVVADFRAALPETHIIVVDNASTDGTAEAARAAGADVVRESRRGKGYALVTGFAKAQDADLVVMVDGDDTYPAEDVGLLVAAAGRDADMVIGTRLGSAEAGAFPTGHTLGNRVFNGLVRLLFGVRTRDLFSGYRVMTRRFLDVSPLIAQGFEIETELSLQALAGGFGVAEIPVRYRPRPAQTRSKLRTVRDGYRILLAMVAFFRDYRPLTFFGLVGLGFLVCSALTGVLAITTLPATAGAAYDPLLAVLSVGLALLGALSLIGGVVLSSIMRRSAEVVMLLSRRRVD
jgi:glycosyltransferase involved in cell wall biosynthesis